VKRGGWEGLVGKRGASPYRGGPTRDWLKVEVRHEGDSPSLVSTCRPLVRARCCWLPGEGAGLSTVGRCEWGVSRRVVAELRERCTVLSGPACEGAERSRGVVWIHPDVVAEVQFNELMQERLRDAVLRAVYAVRSRQTRIALLVPVYVLSPIGGLNFVGPIGWRSSIARQ
jgi:bifunctional non-homologous end joining protein LigD